MSRPVIFCSAPHTQMSDVEDLDIATCLTARDSSDSEDSASDDELVDIISDTEEPRNREESRNKGKPAVPAHNLFPNLELSDDENEHAKNEAESSYFTSLTNTNAKKAKNGSFASFGLLKWLLANISKKGFRQPTPIQRKTIPLIMENRDVVGMARTGSGKTAAFTLPLVQKLKAHSARVGLRALILSPSRELAAQTFKQVKEFSRGTDLRSVLMIGGDSLDEQFSTMMTQPDVVVATPGRFLHLKVEMALDLKTIEYIVFDEADRLFEMGFAEQLNELLGSLPPSRQSLLFSATLPRSLVDFAKAGLSQPVLVRLDADAKISDQLQMAFFSCKRGEREANLLHVLQEVIKLPMGTPQEIQRLKDMAKQRNDEENSDIEDNAENSTTGHRGKRKRFIKERLPPANALPSKHSTIVFVPTKHHVEYITTLLKDAGYLTSFIYGSLDQHARKNQMYQFRIGLTHVLVVTDVAARGIDIPVLANVINYTLPSSSKIFIHRVGRTARAGNSGWAYSIVNEKELPYLLDLELFLGKKVLLTRMHDQKCAMLRESLTENEPYAEPTVSYTDRLVVGAVPRRDLETFQELFENLMRNNYDMLVLRDVLAKGEKLYYRTRQAALPELTKRSKEILDSGSWDDQHLLFGPDFEKEKNSFLASLQNRVSKETVFEFNKKGNDRDENSMVEFMNKRRKQIAPIQRRQQMKRDLLAKEQLAGLTHGIENQVLLNQSDEVGYLAAKPMESVDEKELQDAFEDSEQLRKKRKTFRDPQHFIDHYAPASVIQDQQLSLSSSFANQAANATFDLDTDEKLKNKQVMQWDRKKGNYVNAQSTDKKYIIGESGQKIPATYRLGRFDEWKKSHGLLGARLGDKDGKSAADSGKRYQHKKIAAPKRPDKYRDDYHKQKKKVEKAVESGLSVKGFNKPGQKSELRSTEQIRKNRQEKEKRRAKNARPSKRK